MLVGDKGAKNGEKARQAPRASQPRAARCGFLVPVLYGSQLRRLVSHMRASGAAPQGARKLPPHSLRACSTGWLLRARLTARLASRARRSCALS